MSRPVGQEDEVILCPLSMGAVHKAVVSWLIGYHHACNSLLARQPCWERVRACERCHQPAGLAKWCKQFLYFSLLD